MSQKLFNCKNFQRISLIILTILLHGDILATQKFVSLTSTKIIGGIETTIDQFPYVINLRRDGRFTCGGSLITQNCVLTAAHCVRGVSATSLSVHAGASLLSDIGEARYVEQFFVSPFFSTLTLDMDVAILKLSDRMVGENIATIPLCAQNPGSDELVKIVGWGKTDQNNNHAPNQLRTAGVRIVGRSDCMRAYAGKALLSSTMLCAAVPGETDACFGDSGGPMVYEGHVCGLVSWGLGCGGAEFPGVYTNVSSRRVNAFIRQTLMRHCN